MSDLRTMQSAALLALMLWYRGNKLMRSRTQVGSPAVGKFWDRVKAFSGIDDTDQLATHLLGFKPTGDGMPFSFAGDDEAVIEQMVNQIDSDAMTDTLMLARPGRNRDIDELPSVLVFQLEGGKGPFVTWKYISGKAVRAASSRARSRAFFTAQGGMRPGRGPGPRQQRR